MANSRDTNDNAQDNSNDTGINPDTDASNNLGDASDLNEPIIAAFPKIRQNGRYWENELGQ